MKIYIVIAIDDDGYYNVFGYSQSLDVCKLYIAHLKNQQEKIISTMATLGLSRLDRYFNIDLIVKKSGVDHKYMEDSKFIDYTFGIEEIGEIINET